ncbi:hypothetical protein [Methanobacterium spitsbergense]|uniref:Uncharacterized protein n=1 Tax=Methanobacterium spitsbergense TaxID=2874285 RepID=A0A8T5URH9_9EURY|nr:hypothetical protein [Methanobacterium spitsbergense]MBZ2166284.1 hypothetical protein [Methanobacterium spitsbergense]
MTGRNESATGMHLYYKDTDGKGHNVPVQGDENGRIYVVLDGTDVTINASDIEIGAVEFKDGESTLRGVIKAVTDKNNALVTNDEILNALLTGDGANIANFPSDHAKEANQNPPLDILGGDQTAATGDTNIVTVAKAGIKSASLFNPSTSITMYVNFGTDPVAGNQIVIPPLASKDVPACGTFKTVKGDMRYKSSAAGGILIYELDG